MEKVRLEGFKNRSDKSLFVFMTEVIAKLKSIGKIRLSETYTATLQSFRRFRNNQDVKFSEITTDLMVAYESFLQNNNLCPNSTSFYMRNLRAVYNRAVDLKLTTQRYPFRNVYTGIDKTLKRAILLPELKQIKQMSVLLNPTCEFARDMFLFSFYTRGMAFVDMAFLKKENLSNGTLSYRRQKTGQLLFIKWEKCMQEIVDKYDTRNSKFLLPIINPTSKINHRQQYINAAHKINQYLKIIGQELQLPFPLTMYVARHSWASIARSKNIPIPVISEGMGHGSESTTRIYLASLDTKIIDKANSLILGSI